MSELVSKSGELKITKADDIANIEKSDFKNIDHIHLDLKDSNLDKDKFLEVFGKIKDTEKHQKFHLDLSNIEFDDDKVSAIAKCFQNWSQLKNLHIHMNEAKISTEQFEKLIYDSCIGMKQLEKFHLSCENVNMTTSKRKAVERLIKELPNLKRIRLNFRRNNMTKEELTDLHNLLFHNRLYWD
jgi:hypothetical protein